MAAPAPQPLHPDPVFARAIRAVLRHEGGFVDDPADPGGATNYGISLRYARQLGDLDGDGRLDLDLDRDGDVDAADIRSLTAEAAVKVYYADWWLRWAHLYQALPQLVAVKLFDLAVTMGTPQAVRCLQRAIYTAGGPYLFADGIPGPKTRIAAGGPDPAALLQALMDEAAEFYRDLAGKRPAARKYLAGWLRRAAAEV